MDLGIEKELKNKWDKGFLSYLALIGKRNNFRL